MPLSDAFCVRNEPSKDVNPSQPLLDLRRALD